MNSEDLDRSRVALAAREIDARLMELAAFSEALAGQRRAQARVARAIDDGRDPGPYLKQIGALELKARKYKGVMALCFQIAGEAKWEAEAERKEIVAGRYKNRLRAGLERDRRFVSDVAAAAEWLKPRLRHARDGCRALLRQLKGARSRSVRGWA